MILALIRFVPEMTSLLKCHIKLTKIYLSFSFLFLSLGLERKSSLKSTISICASEGSDNANDVRFLIVFFLIFNLVYSCEEEHFSCRMLHL